MNIPIHKIFQDVRSEKMRNLSIDDLWQLTTDDAKKKFKGLISNS